MRTTFLWQKTWTWPHSCRRHRWSPRGEMLYRLRCPNQCEMVLYKSSRHGISLTAVEYWSCTSRVPLKAYPPVEPLVKKRVPKAVDGKRPLHLAPMETEFLKDILAIADHCAATAYEDGDARKPGWITLRTLGSAWQLEAKDPDTASRLVLTMPTLDDVLMTMDALLRADEAPWEQDPWLVASQAKNRKK